MGRGLASRHRHGESFAAGDSPRRSLHGLVFPVGIAEAMAEAEERLDPGAVVAAVAHEQPLGVDELAGLGLRPEDGGVRLGSWNRNRKAPARLARARPHPPERLSPT